jgi:putative phage-type endonuclease
VYEDKVNGYSKDFSDNEKVQSGVFLEDGIAKWYEAVKNVGTFKPVKMRVHEKYPFLLANPDRLIAGKKIGVEIKNVGERSKHLWGEDGSQVVPDYYFLQAAHYMLVLDYQSWDVVACIGGQELRTYRFERDAEIDEIIIQGASDFWHNHVEKRVEPAKDYSSPGVQELIKKKFNLVSEEVINLPEEFAEVATQWFEAKEDIKHYDNLRKELEAKLLEAIGTAGKALLPNGGFLLRKRVERKAYQVPASSYTTLSLKGV